MFEDKKGIEAALSALSEQLQALNVKRLEIVVCGGAALRFLGYVHRTTLDIDLMAVVERSFDVVARLDDSTQTKLLKAEPLDPAVVEASQRVAKDFNLPPDWLNARASSIMDFGLPNGLMDRVETRRYGENLIVHFLSRYDQIHFKLYAAADQTRKDVHYQDLIDLKPTKEELEAAARWCMTHDISAVFKEVLIDLLTQLGRKDVADKL